MLSYDVVEWGKPLEKIARETPVPRGTEVLVRLKYCGVCHSDVHIREGYFDLGGGRRLHMSERGMQPPVTLGHEPFGTVIAAGSEASDAPIGTDRLVYPWTGCGECARCGEGLDNYCMAPRMIGIQRPGGYADHLIVPHPRYRIRRPRDRSGVGRDIVMLGLSTYAAASKLRPIPPMNRSMIGAGGLGMPAIGMLRAFGHGQIVAVDIDQRQNIDGGVAAGASNTAR